METIADMLDRLLTPDDGGNSEEGKPSSVSSRATARTQFEQMKPSSEK
jgi:hypothetical protein